MRRDQIEVGVKYLGSDKRCYEIVDLTPGWRIGFDLDWVRDDSTRQRTTNGKKVSFRKNNALRTLVWDDSESSKAVILPSRLLRKWNQAEKTREQAQLDHAQAVLKEAARLANWARPSKRMADHSVVEGGRSLKMTTEDFVTLLALIPQLAEGFQLFPSEIDSTLE